MDLEGADQLEAKYRPLYEEAVNPFALFNKAEKDRRYGQLNAADKVTLSTSRFLLQHKSVLSLSLFAGPIAPRPAR